MTEKKEKEQTKKTKLTAIAASPGGCLTLGTAGTIVQECAKGPHDIDLTLEEVGFISPAEREIFKECVFNKVLAKGCNISKGSIPNDTDTTLRQVIEAIKANAS